MKLTKYFYLGVAIVGLSSCMSESLDEALDSKVDKGLMTLNVSLLEPQATRAVSAVSDFPVIVRDADGEVVNSYNKVSDVPKAVVYSVGNYSVESHTPGELGEGTLTQYPYYYGLEVMEISKGATTDVDVICKRKNGSVEVVYDEAFTNFYKKWEITVDDGANTTVIFPDEERTNPNFVYWNFRSELKTLSVNFQGTTKENVVIKSRQDVKKSNPVSVEQSYDDDSEFFHGGDCIVLNFKLKMDGHGTVTGVEIVATNNLFGDETVENQAILVTDSEESFEQVDDNNGNNDPQPQDNSIVLTLFQPITFTMGEGSSLDPNMANVSISTENGIKSLMVTAESTNPDMVESLIAVGAGYGLDFVNAGVEVVENGDLVKFFASLGKTLGVPDEGDKTYDFPVGNFFTLLDVMSGTHTFHLTVTDMNGKTKSGSVVITVNAD